MPSQVVLAVEHYNRIARVLQKKVPVKIALEHQEHVHTTPISTASTSSRELPGTDKDDEVVMLGAHFDSWHAGTGATDNGASSAVMMEAMRILKATGLKLRRTVRIGAVDRRRTGPARVAAPT